MTVTAEPSELSQILADEHRERLRAAREAEAEKRKAEAKAAFDELTRSTYVHSMGWRNIILEESGRARLAHTIGFLEALHCFNPGQAYTLAENLTRYLSHLSDYGGMMESPDGNKDNAGKLLEFPRYRVALSDDGGLGSFSIVWYHAVPHSSWMKLAEELADAHAQARHQKLFRDLEDTDQRDSVWAEAMGEATCKLRIRQDLDTQRYYYPAWDDRKKYLTSETMRYGRSFNGGLIFHHDKDDITRGHWSTHT